MRGRRGLCGLVYSGCRIDLYSVFRSRALKRTEGAYDFVYESSLFCNLTLKQDYDVIIIGGGLLGCATAYQLAKRKAGKVLLLDANEIASQASSRAACLLPRARTKPALMEMVQETYDCIDEIEHLLGESLELQQCGSVTISSSDASLKELEALEEAAVRFGIPNERIDRRRLKELLPWMEVSAVEEARYMPTEAFIDCALLCSGYARAARSLGAELRPITKV